MATSKTVYIPIQLFAEGEMTDAKALSIATKIQKMIEEGYFSEASVYEHANSERVDLSAYDVQQPVILEFDGLPDGETT